MSAIVDRIGSTWHWALAYSLFVIFGCASGGKRFAAQEVISGGVWNRNRGNATAGTKYSHFWLEIGYIYRGNYHFRF